MVYDLIIIGAGPAGITAAIYAARKKLRLLVITKDIGGQAAITTNIENYTGYQYISGPDLATKFEQHIREFKIEVKFEEAESIKKISDGFEVKTDAGTYRSKAIIVATGAKPRELQVPGEREFRNRGVTYCATCDAPLFPNKDVAVIGGGNSGLEATLQLMKIANRIYLIERTPSLRGDEVLLEKVQRSEKVEILTSTNVLEILGDQFVTGVKVEVGGKVRVLDVQGVFIEIGYVPNSRLVEGLVELNKLNEIVIDNRCGTSLEGIFAAGDVTDIMHKQIIIAAGDGARAALCAHNWIQKKG
jgi:alkyl hydroperoxide reductase subunit F